MGGEIILAKTQTAGQPQLTTTEYQQFDTYNRFHRQENKQVNNGHRSDYRHKGTVWFSLMKTKTKMAKNEKITNSLTKTKTKMKKW